MKYKLFLLFVCVICVMCAMLCLYSCQQKEIHIKEESFFSDFKVEDGKVYVYCTLFIENPTGTEKSIVLEALLEDDVKNGLLKEALIDGYSIDESTKCFRLEKGENRLDVVFIGEHAGEYIKRDRTLPGIKITEIGTQGDGSSVLTN